MRQLIYEEVRNKKLAMEVVSNWLLLNKRNKNGIFDFDNKRLAKEKAWWNQLIFHLLKLEIRKWLKIIIDAKKGARLSLELWLSLLIIKNDQWLIILTKNDRGFAILTLF